VKRFWIIIAAVLAVVAVVLFVGQDYDKAFISAALGAIAWFLSYRVQLRSMIKDSDKAEELDDEWEHDEDELS